MKITLKNQLDGWIVLMNDGDKEINATEGVCRSESTAQGLAERLASAYGIAYVDERKKESHSDRKIIQFFVKSVYGNDLEYVANVSDANILLRLTGHKTISAPIRSLIEDLSGGRIRFVQIVL